MYRYFENHRGASLRQKIPDGADRPFAMRLVRFIVHTSSTKTDFIMKCELDPVYKGEGNTGARVTLAKGLP